MQIYDGQEYRGLKGGGRGREAEKGCVVYHLNRNDITVLETAYFTSKQSEKSFSSIEKCTSKIKVPQFLYCHYICMYVCVCVCMHSRYSLHRLF